MRALRTAILVAATDVAVISVKPTVPVIPVPQLPILVHTVCYSLRVSWPRVTHQEPGVGKIHWIYSYWSYYLLITSMLRFQHRLFAHCYQQQPSYLYFFLK